MSALVKGYEYDIFISYRQKDNKGDQWVTAFVNALKTELEATFKEDISIYFDSNPHDGLLETHDVDESLKDKLKCLIFIPIISHTYCDQKSFAWKNEFLAFKKIASADQFGLKIKLANGNVASRILPISIHELDTVDKALLESELGSLRSIDFIFKTGGVNRPLSPREDHPNDNLNKTYYRDQVNKAALSVKEFISAFKNSATTASTIETFANVNEVLQTPGRKTMEGKVKEKRASSLKKWVIPFIIIGVLAAGLIFYTKFPSSPRFTGAERSIAVLPFENIGSEKENEYISDGITSEIINNLSKIADLQGVTGWTTARLYKKTTKNINNIGKELDVASIVTGTIQKEGEQLRVIAELIDVNTGKQIWGGTYNRRWGDVLTLQGELSQIIAANLNMQLTTDEVKRIESKVTNNPSAYEDFLKGKSFFNKMVGRGNDEGIMKQAERHFLDAIKKDSSFALAWSSLGATYMRMALTFDSVDRFNYYNKALIACIRGITFDPEISETNMFMGDILKSVTLNSASSIPFLLRAIELNPNNADAYSSLAWSYLEMGQFEKAEAALIKSTQLNPGTPGNINTWLFYYFYLGDADKFRALTKDTFYYRVFSHFLEKQYDSLLASAEQRHWYSYVGIAYVKLGQTKNAMKIIDMLATQLQTIGSSPTTGLSGPNVDIGIIYAWLGNKDTAMDYLELAYRMRERSLLHIRSNPQFEPLRSEDRFKALVRRIGAE